MVGFGKKHCTVLASFAKVVHIAVLVRLSFSKKESALLFHNVIAKHFQCTNIKRGDLECEEILLKSIFGF